MIKDLGRVVGKSAYEIACDNGFVGSESEWLDSLDGSNYDDSEIKNSINAINNKIPAQASSTNQLADKDFVNSSISTATAEFIGTFNSLTELQATTKTYDNNDYAFVVGTDSDGNTKYNKYKWNGSEWIFEYTLNNSSFTSEQWKAINSNVTDEWRQSVNTSILNKADKTHTHDDRYYTESEIDTKLNSPLPWGYNYLSNGYSANLHYRKIGEGSFTYADNINWSYYSEIEMIHHNASSVFECGTVFVNLRGKGSTINYKSVKYHSKNGGIINLSKTKINYKIDTTNKRISLEILAYCYSNYTNILFRNSLTRTSDMLTGASNFWTFAENGNYVQSSTTMQAGVTSGYTEIPLSVVSIDKEGNDISTTYAKKSDLTGLAVSGHIHDDRYYTESEIDIKLSEKLNKNSPSVSIALNTIKNTDSSYMNMWTKIASCKFGARYALTSLSLEITQSRTSNNTNSFWKGNVHLYTQNELTSVPIYSFICTEKVGYLAEDCIKILIHKLTDTNGNAYLQCDMYLKSPNSLWLTGYYTVLFNKSWTLLTNQDYVSELPSADLVITPTFISKASHDKDGNDITTTYATKAELSGKSDTSHTHSDYATKDDILNHTHNDTYYTETEIDNLLKNKSDTSHTHSDYASKTDLNNKVDKVYGKQLSTNDFTNTDKSNLDTLKSTVSSLQSTIRTLQDKINNLEDRISDIEWQIR